MEPDIPPAWRTYLARVAALAADRADGELDAAAIEGIARELGFADADLAAAAAAGEAALARGRGHAAHRRFDDAIVAFQEALVLLPGQPALRRELAEALLGRWLVDRQQADRDAAEAITREELARDAGWSRGYEVLNELDPPPQRSWSRRWARPAAWVVVGVVVLFAAGAFFMAVTLRPAPPEPVQPTEASAPATPPSTIVPVAQPTTGQAELPLTLVAGPRTAGVNLHVRRSWVTNYATGSFYKVQATVTNDGPQEITRLTGHYELLDATGAQRVSWPATVLWTGQPPLRPRDQVLVTTVSACPPSVTHAKLVLDARDDRPAAEPYLAASPLPLRWLVDQPPGHSLTVRLRELQPWGVGAKRKASVDVEITNGNAPFGELRLVLEAKDPAGKTLGPAEPRTITRRDDGSLLAGETRVVRWYVPLPANFHSFSAAVTEAR